MICSIPEGKGDEYKRRRGSRAAQSGICGMLVETWDEDARGGLRGPVNQCRKSGPRFKGGCNEKNGEVLKQTARREDSWDPSR